MTRARDVANLDGLLTTTGDTYYASAAATPARLGVGSTGQVLTVAGGVPSWATPAAGGGMTLISTTTLSGSSTSLSSIPQTYKHLYIVHNATGSSSAGLRLKINNVSNYYNYSASLITGGAFTDGTSGSDSDGFMIMQVGSNFYGTTWIPNYTLSVVKSQNTSGARDAKQILTTGFWNDSAAITSLQFQSSGSLSGTVYMYGVN